MLASYCMYEERKVQFAEIEEMGNGGVKVTSAGKGKTA